MLWISSCNCLNVFLSMIIMYIDSLVTKILKIKVIKQDSTGHKTYTRHIPLTLSSIHRLSIKNM